MLLECVDCLIHECNTVRQKQHSFSPVAPHQQIAQGNDGAGFASPGCHDDQRFSLVVPLERLSDATDGTRLVVAFDNVLVDWGVREFLSCRSSLNEQSKFRLRVKALDAARWM